MQWRDKSRQRNRHIDRFFFQNILQVIEGNVTVELVECNVELEVFVCDGRVVCKVRLHFDQVRPFILLLGGVVRQRVCIERGLPV